MERYISLQGELHLAEIKNGIAGAYRAIGNTPELKLNFSADKIEHRESKTGNRSVDAVMYKDPKLELSGSLEDASNENIALLMSGTTITVPEKTITDTSLGAVTANTVIDLGLNKLSDVKFKDDTNADISADQYNLDSTFGTVTFLNDYKSVTWSGKSGETTRTTIGSKIGSRKFAVLFKGKDTYTGDKVAIRLWNIEFTPDTEMDLIQDEFAKYSINATALADTSKAEDGELGPFGTITRFSV